MCRNHYRTEKFYKLCREGKLDDIESYYDKYNSSIKINPDLLCIVSFSGKPELYNYIRLLSGNEPEATHCFKIACYNNNLELAKHILNREFLILNKNDCLFLFEWSSFKKHHEMNEWLFDQLLFNLESEVKN